MTESNRNLNERQFTTIYRGEGGHDQPSYYPTNSNDTGAWWTTNLSSAQNYAKSAKDGKVYMLDVEAHEAEQRGLPHYRFVPDPAVRERRRLLDEQA